MRVRGRWRSAGMLAAGCSLTIAAPAVGASSFQKQADAACASAGAKVEHLSKTVTVSVIEMELKIAGSEVSSLSKLTPPGGQAQLYKKFISQTQEQITDTKAVLAAARNDEKSKVESDLKKVASAGMASDQTARSLKLGACAKNYQPESS